MNQLCVMVVLSLLTLNVNGIHDCMWHVIKRQSIDIICLQETHLTQPQEYAFKLHAQGYDILFSHGTSNSVGVLTGIRRNKGITVPSINSHMAITDIVLQDTQVWVINFYGSTKVRECQIQFQEMRQYIIQDSTLIAGDFNSVLASSDRLLGKTDGSTTAFHNLLHRYGLTKCQHDRMYTFQSHSDLS